MYHFLGKLIDVVLPRIKDWNGVRATTGDNSGNLSFGLNPEVVSGFPEIEVNYDAYPGKMMPVRRACPQKWHSLTSLGLVYYHSHDGQLRQGRKAPSSTTWRPLLRQDCRLDVLPRPIRSIPPSNVYHVSDIQVSHAERSLIECFAERPAGLLVTNTEPLRNRCIKTHPWQGHPSIS